MKRSEALKLRAIVEQAVVSIDDKLASEGACLFPSLKNNNSLISAGTRINWGGLVKKAALDLWDTTENNPDNAPNLWEDIEYRKGIRIIPSVITATNTFAKDEFGWWGDKLYKSIVDANVYTPDQYSANWEEVNA